MQRRPFLQSAAAALAASMSWSGLARAADWPSRLIKIVVPFGPGGVADVTARIVAKKLSEQLHQSVIIENRPGAGGVVAGELVARAAPDGYTLLLMSNGTAVSEGLFKHLPFDAQKDFAPISTLGFFDIVVVVPADSRFKTLADLLAYARANPDKLNLGTVNIGSTQNLAAQLFKSTAGIACADRSLQRDRRGPHRAAQWTDRRRGGSAESDDVADPRRHSACPGRDGREARARTSSGAHRARERRCAGRVLRRLVERAGRARQDAARRAAAAEPGGRRRAEVAGRDPQPDPDQRRSPGPARRRSWPTLLGAEIRRWGGVIKSAGIPRQ